MKHILILLSLILTFALTACGGSSKTEQKVEPTVNQTEMTIVENFEALVDKSIELESRITSGDEEEVTTTEYDETKKEILKFLIDNQAAIDNMSPQAKSDFQVLIDKTTLGGQ